jgi:hypothetical protein
MATQHIVESTSSEDTTRPSPAGRLERIDRLIEVAESRLEEQEAHVREVALVSTAVASFELQKMHLLIALLREGRQRLAEGHRE